jgi:hypothetical protein
LVATTIAPHGGSPAPYASCIHAEAHRLARSLRHRPACRTRCAGRPAVGTGCRWSDDRLPDRKAAAHAASGRGGSAAGASGLRGSPTSLGIAAVTAVRGMPRPRRSLVQTTQRPRAEAQGRTRLYLRASSGCGSQRRRLWTQRRDAGALADGAIRLRAATGEAKDRVGRSRWWQREIPLPPDWAVSGDRAHARLAQGLPPAALPSGPDGRLVSGLRLPRDPGPLCATPHATVPSRRSGSITTFRSG